MSEITNKLNDVIKAIKIARKDSKNVPKKK